MTDDHPGSETVEDPRSARAAFPVIGVGASAGGYEAIAALLRGLVLDGMALVVVQHLAPQHESALPVLLGRATKLPVVEIVDNMRVEPDHVYVAPPNAHVALLHGTLHLMKPAGGHGIDFFFRSLAEDLGPRAIGVVLSGMGSDGTAGLKAIKERAGIALVQEPATAKFDAMPSSAIEAGLADRVLGPEALATELTSIARHPYLAKQAERRGPERDRLMKLFVLLRDAFGNDLTYYKQSTIERRLERRMAVQKVEKIDEYIQLVQSNPDELAQLYRDILINVTSFFRDPEVFETLAVETLPRILDKKRRGESIRVWVPACASGEEAYSIAIVLLETLGPRASDHRVQVFGTDVDGEAIARARRGIYPTNIELDVSPERLDRFFVKSDKSYVVGRRVRDLVVFSTQNLAKDAPFSRVDLASCRNVLIYMQPPLQKRVLRVLHYALVPDGTLVLGTSESVGDSSDLFSLVDRKQKIYVKKTTTTALSLLFGAPVVAEEDGVHPLPGGQADRRPAFSAQQLADRRILDRYAPPSVLVNENLDILQFRGDTGPYLAPASGTATLNVLRLVRPELHVDLRQALQRALAGEIVTQRSSVRVSDKGEKDRMVAIEVSPLDTPGSPSRCLLVVFHESREAPSETPSPEPATSAADERTESLEHELAATKEFLQSTIEELESSNEELKSTNEELQSSNEELQSTNEELETSKEELQSSNEELSTVNDELQHRLTDLAHHGNDLANLLRTVRDPVVFVGTDGKIARFTSAAQRLLGLAPSDVGRLVDRLRAFFPSGDMFRLMVRAVERVGPVSEAMTGADGRGYTVTAQPFSGAEGAIEGALLSFDDVDAAKRGADFALDVSEYADKVLGAILHPLAMLDEQTRVVWVNRPFLEAFARRSDDVIGKRLADLGPGNGWADAKLGARIDETLRVGAPFDDVLVHIDAPAPAGTRTLHLSGSRIVDLGRESKLVLLTIVDVGRREPQGDSDASRVT